jgi:hypothetical protein
MRYLLLVLFPLFANAQALSHRIDIRAEFTNGVLATNLFNAATNKYDDVADRNNSDGRHLSLKIVVNNGTTGTNFTVIGRLILTASNKVEGIYTTLLNATKPPQSSGYVEWHQCPVEGSQTQLGWHGCLAEPTAFYRRFIWP